MLVMGHRSLWGRAFNGGLHRLATDFQPHCLSWNDIMTTLGKCLKIEERPESCKIRDVVPSLQALVPQTKWCMFSAPDLHANKLHFQSELWLWLGGDTHYTLFISFFNVLQLFLINLHANKVSMKKVCCRVNRCVFLMLLSSTTTGSLMLMIFKDRREEKENLWLKLV